MWFDFSLRRERNVHPRARKRPFGVEAFRMDAQIGQGRKKICGSRSARLASRISDIAPDCHTPCEPSGWAGR